jgi:serine/threonine-protein kinase RsbW
VDTDLILELPNDLRAIPHAVEYVVRRCSSCEDIARRLRLNFRVGLSEALSNAMLYGNGADPSKRVRLDVVLTESAIIARVTDQGNGFDPRRVPDPTTPENLTRSCGRGIFLMRELLDEVRFNECGNSVTLVLRLETAGVGGAASA